MKSIRLVILVLLVSSYKISIAGEFGWLQSGELNLRLDIEDSSESIVDPEKKLLEFTDYGLLLYGLFDLQVATGEVNWAARFRPRAKYSRLLDATIVREQKVEVDELYIEHAVNSNSFLSIGKLNISNGVGVGYNPTDFFSEGKEVDLRLHEQEQKDQRKGNYLLALDWLKSNSSWSVIFAPEIDSVQEGQSRFLFRYDRLLKKWNSDIAGLVFIGDRLGIGLNYSQTLNNNWVWYSEFSLREGRDRNILNVTEQDENKLFFEGIIGSNYTSSNGITWYAEYWYLENGYDDQEWEDILSLTAQSTARLVTPDHEAGLSQLVAINEGFRPRYLRQNYIFSRLSYSIKNAHDLSIVHIQNIDGNSGLTRLRYGIELTDRCQIELQVENIQGDKDQEFSVRVWKNYIGLTFTVLL